MQAVCVIRLQPTMMMKKKNKAASSQCVKKGRIWFCFSQPRSSSRKNSDCAATWAFNGHTELTARVHRRRQNKICKLCENMCMWMAITLKVVTYVYPHICLSSIEYKRRMSMRAHLETCCLCVFTMMPTTLHIYPAFSFPPKIEVLSFII